MTIAGTKKGTTISVSSVSAGDGGAFFEGERGRYVPRAHARSPWSENLVHGRLVSGLMAREAERGHLVDGMHPARMTTDLFRPIPMGPLDIRTSVRREGRRLRIVEVEASATGVPVALASIQALRPGAEAAEVAWAPTMYHAPAPELLDPPKRPSPRHFGEVRRSEDTSDRRFSWFRETCPLLEGFDDTPFEIAAMAADWVSPFTNMGTDSLQFINADVTLYLSRLPVGPWIGFENLDHKADNGIAVSVCALHDTHGRIGTAASAALPY